MRKTKPYATYTLAAVCVLVYVIEIFFGGSENTAVAVAFGALYTPLVLEYHQWWRLFTAMFVHFGIEHLGSNMISLLAVGSYVEEYFGRVRFVILYLVSGLCGNLLVLASDMHGENYGVSAGASGAICGLLSVFILLALLPEYRRAFPLGRVLFGIALTLLPGLTDPSISMTAHLGGLIGGFVCACILNLTRKKEIPREA